MGMTYVEREFAERIFYALLGTGLYVADESMEYALDPVV